MHQPHQKVYKQLSFSYFEFKFILKIPAGFLPKSSHRQLCTCRRKKKYKKCADNLLDIEVSWTENLKQWR